MEHQHQTESVIARVSQQLAAIEKRDWELWLVVAGIGIIISAGLVALLLPAAVMQKGTLHVNFDVPRELFLGLVALLVLFNTYIVSRRFELRRVREVVISTAIQNELIRLQSFADPLTEVYNRRALDDMAGKYIARAQRLEKPLTFMVVDADRFKDINTRFGHLTGDFVIAEVAALLKGSVRGSDSVVRTGGDEFLLILADATLEGAGIVAARIVKSTEDWNRAGQLEGFNLLLSIGIAEWTRGKNLDQVMNEADKEMYIAKEARQRSSA